ncbi:bifunctional transcriptional activator/DNA repair enzyme AdaA [Bacillus xiapuensis]|uniref:bifunctional transcriptional activator/DNA repair enzyme AdaA n=1 Tax=Bacillus xiapuensis TaxID=2014075 RepID=UPI000C231F99|nr:Ada metal-binding domain-containing protein [Bacillus xiapuensis]
MIGLVTEQQWQAITTNDASYDHVFLYGVCSTGIFCRPSCKSRNPNKEHVRIFQDARHALEEGFRPCKRCNPCSLRMPDEERVIQIKEYIHEHYHEPLTLTVLAGHFHGSPHHLQKTFKRIMKVSPIEYIQRVRTENAKRELIDTDQSVADIGVKVGWLNTSYFITLFKQQTGLTPKQFRMASREKLKRLGGG